jgi:hypothetical protein
VPTITRWPDSLLTFPLDKANITEGDIALLVDLQGRRNGHATLRDLPGGEILRAICEMEKRYEWRLVGNPKDTWWDLLDRRFRAAD